MSRNIVTLLTDFGADCAYVAQMRGALLSINPRVTLVDITQGIPPQDVAAGSRVWQEVGPRFPADSIHVGVVDPGVGTERALVYACIGGRHFLAPDNGLLTGLLQQEPPSEVRRLAAREYWAAQVSATFHGRDILAPVAAHLSLGLDPARLGPLQPDLVRIPIPSTEHFARRIRGQVLSIDSFGNLLTNIEKNHLPPANLRARCRVSCCGRHIVGLATTYGEHPRGALVALIGSNERLEVAVVCGHAARELSAKPGDEVEVSWEQADSDEAGPAA
jgi:S-adenosylmethionine hydrolase